MKTLLTTLHSKYIHPSLALPYLAAFCQEGCGELCIGEYTIHQPKENLLAQILGSHSDVVCFSVYVWNRQLTLELATALRLASPQIKIVLGGPEVSFESAEFFDRWPVDAIICGEGELPLRHLLTSWQNNRTIEDFPGLQLPGKHADEVGQSLLAELDQIPSPYRKGLVNLQRGYVYYESSRGCPYRCSFCMSALDQQVRSFSMARIKQDLGWLMDQEVAQIKFVDRTFNYDAERSCEIIRYILARNKSTRFHFEIGADLLTESLLKLLERVPAGMFQFEIGVQTTSEKTLAQIERRTNLGRLKENVKRLMQAGNIHLHLDLIAGLPGESREDFLHSLRQVLALGTPHVQLELVKLLPGAPLRKAAATNGLVFDPSPPYSVLRTSQMTYADLEELRGLGRLLDLFGNSGRFSHFFEAVDRQFQDRVDFYRALNRWWCSMGLFAEPLALNRQFEALADFIQSGPGKAVLGVGLARDYALAGRVVPGKAPGIFNTQLTEADQALVKARVKKELDQTPPGEKLQYFATLYGRCEGESRVCLALYLYRSRSGESPRVEEIYLQRTEFKAGSASR